MKNIVTVLLAATVLIMTSCATLFTGTKDRITFETNPSGAIIYIDGVEQCRTPCTMLVKRSLNDTYVDFKLDGYETKMIRLSKEFNVVSVINLGNLFGWAIDAVSGAVMQYDRRSYEITLDRKKTSVINPTQINIDTQNNVVELYVADN